MIKIPKENERGWAEFQKAKFNLSMLERLDSLKTQILTQVEEGLDYESKQRETRELTAIMNTAGSTEGNNLLLACSCELEEAINPQYPYDFPDDLLIKHFFQQYKEAFLIAVGLNAQKWDFILQEAAKATYYSRIEDKVDIMKDLVKDLKRDKKKDDK